MKNKKNKKKTWIIILIIIAVALAGSAYAYMRFRPGSDSLSIKRYVVKRGDLSILAIGSGKIASAETRTQTTDNYISAVKVKTGDLISAGDPLAEFYAPVEGNKFFESDYDGVITSLNIGGHDPNTGKNISMFSIGSLEKLQLNISVSEKDIYRVKTGQEAEVYIDSLTKTFEGEVISINRIGRTAGDYSVYDVKVGFDNTDDRIHIGMSGSGRILVEKKENVMLVPVEAIIEKGGIKYVIGAGWETNRSSSRSDYYIEVETGSSDMDFVEITKGDIEGIEILLIEENVSALRSLIFR